MVKGVLFRQLGAAALSGVVASLASLASITADAQTLFRHCLEDPQECLGQEAYLLDGAEISRRWYVANPEEGAFDWHEIDDHIAYLRGLGKLSALKVYTACPPQWRLWDEESVTPHWVYAVGADKCGPRTAYMRLGQTNDTNDQANGNSTPDIDQKQVAGDGMTSAAMKGGSQCRATNRTAGHEYVYFDLDDSLFFDVNYPLTVAISYFDDNDDTIELEYDSRSVVNVVQNSSMESAEGGGPASWVLWAGQGNQAFLTRDRQFVRAGTYSAKFSCTEAEPSSWSSMGQYGRQFDFFAGVSYRFSAWIRAAAPVTLTMRLKKRQDGSVLASKELSVGPELKWYQLEFACAESSKDNWISFAFQGVNDVWVDDVMLVAMGGSDPYRSAGVVRRSGTGKWKTAQWHICDARFADKQSGGCDLRIKCGEESDVYVRYIDVHADKTQVEPAYWDPVYQRCYGEFIDAFGARYNGADDVAYVIVSFALWGEVCFSAGDPHRRQGYSLDEYLCYVRFVAQRYRSAFPNKPLAAPLGNFSDSDGSHRWEALVEIPEYLATLGYQMDYCGGDGDPAPWSWYDSQGGSTPGTYSYIYVWYDDLGRTCSESLEWHVHPKAEDVWQWVMHVLSLKADHIRAYKQELVLNPWAFEFAKTYLGKTVWTTDGVWIGLRQGERGNYDFFLTQDDLAPGGKTRVTDGYKPNTWVGGKECRYTDVANGQDSIYLNIDDRFECGGPDSPVNISVTYFDAGDSEFIIEYDSEGGDPYKTAATVQLENTNTWRTADCVIEDAALANGQYGNDLRIRAAGSDDVYLHFVWVRRVSGIGGSPSGPPPGSPPAGTDDTADEPPSEPASAPRSLAPASELQQSQTGHDASGASAQPEDSAVSQRDVSGLGGDWVVWCSPASGQGSSSLQTADTWVSDCRCWATDIAEGRDCVYFEIAGAWASGESGSSFIVTVAYFDAGRSEFAVEYRNRGSDQYHAVQTLRLTGTNAWKTVNCDIQDPAFCCNGSGPSHIRVRALGSDDIYVRFLVVRKAD